MFPFDEVIMVMGWHETGDKPLPEPKMTPFTDTYMHNYVM